jgi:hypothetical protein
MLHTEEGIAMASHPTSKPRNRRATTKRGGAGSPRPNRFPAG